MDLLYFGGLCTESLLNEVSRHVRSPFIVAQNSLEKALVNGFQDNGFANLTVNCLPSVPYEVLCTKIYCRSIKDFIPEGIKFRTFPILKIPIMKYLVFFLSAFYRTLNHRLHCKERKMTIFVAVNFVPVTVALLLIAKTLDIKIICMLTDCARNTYALRQDLSDSKTKKGFLKLYMHFCQWVEHQYDGYIFLTEKMHDTVNLKNKPHMILEGISHDDFKVKYNNRNQKKIIMYAGSLFKIYGVEKILEVVNLIDDQNIELHIYGDGESKETIKLAAKNDQRISYKGFVDRSLILQSMQEATLLINLRNPEYEYTQLSFPSKLMEYMASGTPVFSTKLEGIPDEYYQYIYFSESYDNIVLAKEIKDILNRPFEELRTKGDNARNFIIENKNQRIQAKRVKDFIEEVI